MRKFKVGDIVTYADKSFKLFYNAKLKMQVTNVRDDGHVFSKVLYTENNDVYKVGDYSHLIEDDLELIKPKINHLPEWL